jgi:hypothetical protein
VTLIPHISLPFRFVNGAAAVSEQGSLAEIADCVAAIVRYPLGSRPELPEFGLPDQVFRQDGPDVAVISATVTSWEPRAAQLVTTDTDDLAAGIASVAIEVRATEGAPS